MKTPKPKFTDLARYPHGYTDSKSTDLAATFRRVRREIEKAEAEKAKVVTPIKKRIRA